MSTSIAATSGQPRTDRRGLVWFIRQVASYEVLFVLFLASDSLELRFNFGFNTTLPILMLCMAWGAWILLNEGLFVRGLKVVGAFLLFYGYIILSYSWTPSVTVSLDRIQVFGFLNVWCVVSSAMIIAGNRQRMVRFLCALVGWGLVLATIGLQIWWEFGTVQKYSPDGRAHINWGNTVAPAAIITFMVVLYARPLSRHQLIGGALFLYCVFYLVAGGGRGAFIAGVLPCLIPLMVIPALNKKGLHIPRFQFIGLAAVFALVVAFILLFFSGNELSLTLSRLIGTLDKDASVVTGATRLHYLPAAYAAWLEAPLFGHGIGAFPLLFRGFEQPGSYPHNIVLEILAELGIVGLLIFLYFIFASVRHLSMARLRDDPMLMCCLMLVGMATISAMVSSNLGGNRMVYLTVGLLCARSWHTASGHQGRKPI